MLAQNIIKKNKLFNIQNEIFGNQRIHNINRSPKMIMNNPIKFNECEYFPIETDKSKNGGQTIYLVAEESNYNNNYDKKIIPRPERKHNSINLNIISLKEKDNIKKQRSIEIQIMESKLKKKNLNSKGYLFISENKSYDINSFNKNNNSTKNKIKIVNNNPNNIYTFDNLFICKANKGRKNSMKMNCANNFNINNINNINKISSTYKKKLKIKSNQNLLKNDGMIKTPKNKLVKKCETLNILNLNQNCGNILKEENNNINNDEKISLNETKKKEDNQENEYLTKNYSSQEDYFSNTNLGMLNRSLDEINDNIDSLYNSLSFGQHNLFEDLNNSKIMEKNFLNGMKNQERKNSLKNAMERYNRFKSHGKLKKVRDLDAPPATGTPRGEEELNTEIKEKNKIEIKEIEYNNNNSENDIKNDEGEKQEENNENENQNEFSFNSELKKFEKINNLENVSKEQKDKENIDKNENNNNNYNNNKEIVYKNNIEKEKIIEDNTNNEKECKNNIEKEKKNEENNNNEIEYKNNVIEKEKKMKIIKRV